MSPYTERFRNGWVPDQIDLEGRYAVHLVGPLLPQIRVLRQCKVFERAGAGISGINEFLGFLRVARFRVERGRSLSDPSLEVIRIVYDDPRNPFFVRPLVDEIRQIGEGTYLGQGMYSVLGQAVWAFWFQVERI